MKPLPFDIAKANQILDGLGYMRGSNGIREVPATTGKYAQPAHEMSYDMMVTTALDFSGQREFDIIANDWAKIGVKINFENGGDSQQAYAIETAGNYTKYDMRSVGLGRLHRPRLHALGADPAAVVQLERYRL